MDPQSIILNSFKDGRKRGVLHLYNEGDSYKGNTICLNDQDLVNFGSGSFLGLELNPHLINGVIDAVKRHGTQFPSSRAFVSSALYTDLESQLAKIFGDEIIVTTSTSIAHLDAIPALIGNGDSVLVDQSAHASIQSALRLLFEKNVPITTFRHNDLNDLERKIKKCSRSGNIWIMLDGIYSMHGDFAPLESLKILQQKYPQIILYVDDAHGVSWFGENGKGFAQTVISTDSRVVFSGSLNKSFAAGGGFLSFSDALMKEVVRLSGANLIFSGPIQPPMLGAGIASANLHLKKDIIPMQNELFQRIDLINLLAKQKQLPMISVSRSPIFFLALGKVEVAFNLVKRLRKEGFYANSAGFPAVPVNRSGLRFSTTLLQSFEDIKRFINAVEYNLPLALADENSSMEELYKFFRKEF